MHCSRGNTCTSYSGAAPKLKHETDLCSTRTLLHTFWMHLSLSRK